MNENKDNQDAWFKSFIMWLVTDTLLVATAIVYFNNVLIPSFAMKDVYEIREKLIGVIKGDSHPEGWVDPAEGGIAFDATKYLYISSRVADHFPGLKESLLISKFSTPFPTHSYNHTSDETQVYDSTWDTLEGGLVAIFIFALANFVEIPEPIRDCIMQVLHNSGCRGFILMFTFLYNANTMLVIIPIVLIFGAVYTIYSRSSKFVGSIIEKRREERAAATENAHIFESKSHPENIVADIPPKHHTRRASVAAGQAILHQLNNPTAAPSPPIGSESSDGSESNYEDSSSSQMSAGVLSNPYGYGTGRDHPSVKWDVDDDRTEMKL